MSYQSVVIVGNLGRDPEIHVTPLGQSVCHLSVATTRSHKEDGEVKSITSWFQVSTWGKTAESCKEYLKQGAKILVEGQLNADPKTGGPRVFTRQDGTAGASYEINANKVKFLSSLPDVSTETDDDKDSLLSIPF
jgi:single-strand DNA-binding protein